MTNLFEEIALAQKNGKKAVFCLVVDTLGSTPQKVGAKMLVFEDGTIVGTIGGGSVEKEVIEKAKELLHWGKATKVKFDLEEDLAMSCGGGMEVYMEPITPLPDLFIFGAGHIGKAVAQFASKLGFSITLIDDRDGIFTENETQIYNCIQENYFKAIDTIHWSNESYAIIVTPKHAYDEELLAILAKKTFKYLGMIGSERKVALIKSKFIENKTLTSDEIAKVDMPIGIKIAAQSPEEIAISIVAKLIDVKNSKQ